jgi:hypothetical protein
MWATHPHLVRYKRPRRAIPTPCNTYTVQYLHRAIPTPCNTYTVQYLHRAIPTPCNTYTVQYLHRAIPTPCNTHTVQYPHRAIPTPCNTYTVQYLHRAIPTPCNTYTVQYPGPLQEAPPCNAAHPATHPFAGWARFRPSCLTRKHGRDKTIRTDYGVDMAR